jgi:hypothetical protein
MAAISLSTNLKVPGLEDEIMETSSATLGMAATSLAMAAASLGKVLEDPNIAENLPEILEAAADAQTKAEYLARMDRE